MADKWLTPLEPAVRRTSDTERGELLVDLLELADALPAAPRRPLDAPPFKDLCARR